MILKNRHQIYWFQSLPVFGKEYARTAMPSFYTPLGKKHFKCVVKMVFPSGRKPVQASLLPGRLFRPFDTVCWNISLSISVNGTTGNSWPLAFPTCTAWTFTQCFMARRMFLKIRLEGIASSLIALRIRFESISPIRMRRECPVFGCISLRGLVFCFFCRMWFFCRM